MLQNILIVLNLVVLESMLSVDNAAVLAVMVKDLPPRNQKKALRYGLAGAYVLRGLCLLFASLLLKLVWLKIVGGLYLLWLSIGHFTKANDTVEETSEPKESRIYKWASRVGFSQLVSVIILVEIMDLTFSLDNIFAAVALSPSYWVVFTGVAIGMLAMRFVAGGFLVLMERFPALENSAFVVIGLLGLKLVSTSVLHYAHGPELGERFDLYYSLGLMFVFFVPLLKKRRTDVR